MAKDTFHNLSSEKKEKILDVLKTVFRDKPFHEVTVKEIVEESGIARGSFYQYFDDLKEAYFEVLNSELGDIHSLFVDIFKEQNGNIRAALVEYGESLSHILFETESYNIYKNYFIYWNENLEREWEVWKSCEEKSDKGSMNDIMNINFDSEKINYIKGIIHNLIRHNYMENWSAKVFSDKFNKYVEWILGGIE